jgi:hypothetical protein
MFFFCSLESKKDTPMPDDDKSRLVCTNSSGEVAALPNRRMDYREGARVIATRDYTAKGRC